MTRRMSLTRRMRIFLRDEGQCGICGSAIDGTHERWDVDHIVPYALTRDDSDENLRPVHERCHRGTDSKTSGDIKIIAKAKRVEAKHKGAKPKPKRLIAGSKGSGFRIRLDGTVIREK